MALSDGQGTVHKLHCLVIKLVSTTAMTILKNCLNLQIHIQWFHTENIYRISVEVYILHCSQNPKCLILHRPQYLFNLEIGK